MIFYNFPSQNEENLLKSLISSSKNIDNFEKAYWVDINELVEIKKAWLQADSPDHWEIDVCWFIIKNKKYYICINRRTPEKAAEYLIPFLSEGKIEVYPEPHLFAAIYKIRQKEKDFNLEIQNNRTAFPQVLIILIKQTDPKHHNFMFIELNSAIDKQDNELGDGIFSSNNTINLLPLQEKSTQTSKLPSTTLGFSDRKNFSIKSTKDLKTILGNDALDAIRTYETDLEQQQDLLPFQEEMGIGKKGRNEYIDNQLIVCLFNSKSFNKKRFIDLIEVAKKLELINLSSSNIDFLIKEKVANLIDRMFIHHKTIYSRMIFSSSILNPNTNKFENGYILQDYTLFELNTIEFLESGSFIFNSKTYYPKIWFQFSQALLDEIENCYFLKIEDINPLVNEKTPLALTLSLQKIVRMGYNAKGYRIWDILPYKNQVKIPGLYGLRPFFVPWEILFNSLVEEDCKKHRGRAEDQIEEAIKKIMEKTDLIKEYQRKKTGIIFSLKSPAFPDGLSINKSNNIIKIERNFIEKLKIEKSF